MSSRSKDYDISYKVLLIGESGVGKTSLIKSYSKPNETFTPSLLSTVGIDFANVITIVDGVRVRLQIWDTAGQERFRTLTSLHFRGTKHDLMYEEVVIVGNKSDFEKRRWQVDTQAGQEFARQLGLKFYETSAKTKENVQEVFEELAKSMKYANHPNLVLDGDHGDFDFVDGFTLRSYDFPERAKNSHNCCKVK
ncbi:uncharacterized protein [Porites lutea]|uniref:uncharacterized protein isoform X2 n=1 Tax=Porites lutea TaxID=51062 RepID=UPI003CC59D8B